VNETNLNNND